jgi:hypothetical protein
MIGLNSIGPDAGITNLMDLNPSKSRRRVQFTTIGFWQLQCVGWLGLYLIAVLASAPLHEGTWLYIYWAAFTVLGFLASLILRARYRHLLRHNCSWQRFLATVAGLSYLLSFPCLAATLLIVRYFRGESAQPFHWGKFLTNTLADSLGGFIILVAWSGIYFGIKQWQTSSDKEERMLRLESMAREAELRALRYQVTPHFLFNTLNGISTLVGEGETQAAREMIALLGDFLRTTLETSSNGDVTLRHEVRHMEQYLAIEQVRLGDRLKLSISLDPVIADALVPNLLLQPVIENAIRHGIAHCTEPGLLAITAKLDKEERVVISISNAMELYRNPQVPERRMRNGMGLENTRNRLHARFDSSAAMEIHHDDPQVWQVTLRFPYEVN